MQSTPPQSDTARRLALIAEDLAAQGLLPAMPSLVSRLAEELAQADVPRPGKTRAGFALEIGLVLLAVHGWPRTAYDADDWVRKAVDLADRLAAHLGGAAE